MQRKTVYKGDFTIKTWPLCENEMSVIYGVINFTL